MDNGIIEKDLVAAVPAVVTQTAQPSEALLLFGAEDKNWNPKCSVLRYDPHQQQQTERIHGIEGPTWGATYSVIGGSIFVVGVWSNPALYCSPRVSEFVVREATWRERALPAVGRIGHAAVVLTAGQTLLAVFGGENGGCPLSSCEVYNVSLDRWSSMPNMREARSAVPAAACLPGDNRVFVFGGANISGRLASVEFCRLEVDYEEATATEHIWQAAAPMRTARYALAVTAFRGGFIVAGGRGAPNTVELFSPPNDSSPCGQWTALADMHQPRYWFTLVTFGGTVFALGGDAPESRNTIEEFSASTDPADSSPTDLTSWRWSPKNPVRMLYTIRGAGIVRQ